MSCKIYPTWCICLQGGRTWWDFGDRKRIPQGFGRAQICKFLRQKCFFLQLNENRHLLVVVFTMVSMRRRSTSKTQTSKSEISFIGKTEWTTTTIFAKSCMKASWLALDALQEQANFHWKLFKSTMTCVESHTMALPKLLFLRQNSVCGGTYGRYPHQQVTYLWSRPYVHFRVSAVPRSPNFWHPACLCNRANLI